jgi:KamA family protein
MLIKKENFSENQTKYKAFSINNIKEIPQIQKLSEQELFEIEVVSHVLPFKSNSYVINELIDWDNIPNDPLYILTIPQKEMLIPEHFDKIAKLLKSGADKETITNAANSIRMQLNPHPAGQLELNVPKINGEPVEGMQHKYRETALFFPSQGQTCHAYCTFCFRWPQFVGLEGLKFASKQSELLQEYLKCNPKVTDILFTGGDPLIMSSNLLNKYIDPLLSNVESLKNIRIGSKVLAYWPYKFLTDPDSSDLLKLFEKVVKSGKHLALMAHFNHPRELETKAVKEAIRLIRSTGAEIRTQSPILNHINADTNLWSEMWKKQVSLGCIPYYMFVARETGAAHYFHLSLEKTYKIFKEAYSKVSGICRTVRGPSMSAAPGKVQILGITEIKGEKVFVLQFIQGRNPDWVLKPFFAKFNPEATWLFDLEPAFGEKKFFWQEEYENMTRH